MNIKVKNIQEKDIDFVLINEFSINPEFVKLYNCSIDLSKYRVVEVIHSLMDDMLGESDITVIFSNGINRHALLIENKINAIAMPEQSNRYFLRAEKQVGKDLYHTYDIFIVAPQKYLEINSEAQKYPNQLSYEKILEYLRQLDNRKFQTTCLSNFRLSLTPVMNLTLARPSFTSFIISP